MKSRCFFVVGDKFHEFAEGKDVLTLHQLKALTCLPGHLLDTHNVLILGQGVQEDEVRCILRHYENSADSSARFEIADLRRVLDRAPSGVSHKRVPHNTLIGTPRRKSGDEFEIPFNIDERCELMGDHQTGQHVQGMILVEAFRQSFLAVTETFFPFGDEKTYFVINVMNTEFHNFLFPLPAHIEYRILEADSNGRRARYRTAMAAMQNGVQCATAEVSFTVYPARTIAQKEAELARMVTQTMLVSRQQALAAPVPRALADAESVA
ncbi:AfsA-related hotdog domain-containing protein [Aquabacterium sp. A7-Y]|uniref:AfsA-related hotdog domain-containing protein n=1 Tax=Aquabacterium sp. A7-Y TaxID=1349605 RepID=UPI00223DB47D|nr:AfsA-related hotdog domain-containing protein [Aquabacterium sp. A7-Y]MCW7539301.1 AfsA-related hotdog domain-containing protein [Aquabacterium sp. A7-Y]